VAAFSQLQEIKNSFKKDYYNTYVYMDNQLIKTQNVTKKKKRTKSHTHIRVAAQSLEGDRWNAALKMAGLNGWG